MIVVGRACLILALGAALYGIGASLYGARAHRQAWIESGRRAMYAVFGIVAVAFALLESAFLRSDFSFDVVASHSSTTTPDFYKATAIWSSQEGSLLLWILLLAIGYVVSGFLLGRLIFAQLGWGRYHDALALLAGLVVLAVVGIIPVIGWLVGLVALLLGAGALALVVTQRVRMRPAPG